MNKKEYFESKKGEAVAILCSRYWWRGIIVDIGENDVILSDIYLVQRTGKLDGKQAKLEEAGATDLLISFDSIEIAGQFPWCFYGYQNKK